LLKDKEAQALEDAHTLIKSESWSLLLLIFFRDLANIVMPFNVM
jgi:hypothetical protein